MVIKSDGLTLGGACSSPDAAAAVVMGVGAVQLHAACEHGGSAHSDAGARTTPEPFPKLKASVQVSDASITVQSDAAVTTVGPHVKAGLSKAQADLHIDQLASDHAEGTDNPHIVCTVKAGMHGCRSDISVQALQALLQGAPALAQELSKLKPSRPEAAAAAVLPIPAAAPAAEPAGKLVGDDSPSQADSGTVGGLQVQVSVGVEDEAVLQLIGLDSKLSWELKARRVLAHAESGKDGPTHNVKIKLATRLTVDEVSLASPLVTPGSPLLSVGQVKLRAAAIQLPQHAGQGQQCSTVMQVGAEVQEPHINLQPGYVQEAVSLATALGSACGRLAQAKAEARAAKAAASSASDDVITRKPRKPSIQAWEIQVNNASIAITHITRCVSACTLVAGVQGSDGDNTGSSSPSFPATQILRLTNIAAVGAPQDSRWVLRARGVSLQQQAVAVDLTSAPPHQPDAALLAAVGVKGNTMPALDATPLTFERLEIRSRSTRDFKLLRINTESLKMSADFDTLLLGLGLAQFGASTAASAAAAMVAAMGRCSAAPADSAFGALHIETSSRKKANGVKVPVVVELRVQDLEAVARVGLKDDIQVTAGLIRASTRLKVPVCTCAHRVKVLFRMPCQDIPGTCALAHMHAYTHMEHVDHSGVCGTCVCVQEAVVDEIVLAMNGRNIITANYVSALQPEPCGQDVPHAAGAAAAPAPATSGVAPAESVEVVGSPGGPSASGGMMVCEPGVRCMQLPAILS